MADPALSSPSAPDTPPGGAPYPHARPPRRPRLRHLPGRNPYRVPRPAVVSFSGGRTSAYLLKHILDAFDGRLPGDVAVVFANTGMERGETLDFVDTCARAWSVDVAWLEYDWDTPHRTRVVDFRTASRAGEPFAALIARKGFVPSVIAVMYSVVGTLALNGIDVLRWLEAWLEECRPTAGRPVAVAAMVDERGAQARLHGSRMTDRVECRYHGRDFTAGELALLRALIAVDPQPTRAELSREFCRRTGWFKPDGELKDMMAKVTMLAMHRDDLIVLPPPRGRQHRPKPIVFGPDTEPPLLPAPTTLDEVRSLDLRPVVRETREGKLWNEFIARYHYLGYKTLVGAQLRYAVHDRNGWPVAILGFSTAAWKLAPRDRFIGWTPRLREKNLPLVVDNPRFLILPWIEIPNLGSHILAIVRRRLPDDWAERYGTTPVLIETFVETPRYTGAVYRASGWLHVGTTQGRGRYDRQKQFDKPKKDIWLRPLRKDWKRTLNR